MKAPSWIAVLLVMMTGCSDPISESNMQKTKLAQEWFRGIYGSDPTVADSLAADDVFVTYPIFMTLFDTPVVRGKQAVKELAVGFAERWKETEIEYHETIVQDDRVVLVWSFRGRNVGSARAGVEPTNEYHSWGGITLIRFNADGKIIAEIGEESEPGPIGRITPSPITPGADTQTSDEPAVPVEFSSSGHGVRGKFFHGKSPAGGHTLLLLQGFPGNPNDVLGLGETLAGAGVNVLTFNYSGTYESEGEYSMESTMRDIEASFSFLHRDDIVKQYGIDTTKLILGGWSYGGGMGLVYASEHPEVDRVISIAGTDHGEFARQYAGNKEFAGTMDETFEQLKAPNGPVKFEGKGALKRLVQSDPAKFDLRMMASRLAPHDILLIAGLDDQMVTMEDYMMPLYRRLRQEGADRLRFIIHPTDHSFGNVRKLLANDISDWIRSNSER